MSHSEKIPHSAGRRMDKETTTVDSQTSENFDITQLKNVTDKLSKIIEQAVISNAVYEDVKEIPEVYVPQLGRILRHSAAPDNNHAWRLISPTQGVLEIRTGPFHDDVVGKDYDPELKVTLPQKTPEILLNGNDAFEKAVGIIEDVFPENTKTLTRNLNLLVGN